MRVIPLEVVVRKAAAHFITNATPNTVIDTTNDQFSCWLNGIPSDIYYRLEFAHGICTDATVDVWSDEPTDLDGSPEAGRELHKRLINEFIVLM